MFKEMDISIARQPNLFWPEQKFTRWLKPIQSVARPNQFVSS